jgi:hypothetical protein
MQEVKEDSSGLMTCFNTPMPKADFQDKEELNMGKRAKRINSQEFNHLLILEDISTAQDSQAI